MATKSVTSSGEGKYNSIIKGRNSFEQPLAQTPAISDLGK